MEAFMRALYERIQAEQMTIEQVPQPFQEAVLAIDTVQSTTEGAGQ